MWPIARTSSATTERMRSASGFPRIGVAVIPVSAVPVQIELGAYELTDDGAVDETGRAPETVHVPLAHTEGGLTASMTRGALAAGTVRTYVLHDRITRASCFVCHDAA